MLEEDAIKVIKNLAHPIRVKVLDVLERMGPLSFTDVLRMIDTEEEVQGSQLSYHLSYLLRSGMIDKDKEFEKYRITAYGRRLLALFRELMDVLPGKEKKLLVRTSKQKVEEFSRSKIIACLIHEAGMPQAQAEEIAREVEEKLRLIGIGYLTAPLIREYVNAFLIEKGLEEYRFLLTRCGMPVHDIDEAIKGLIDREGPLYHEAISLGRRMYEEYSLVKLIRKEGVADAHLFGLIHIASLGSWLFTLESVFHDLRLSLRYGLPASISPSKTSYPPPATAREVLEAVKALYVHTLASSNASQAVDFFNVFLAPYVKGLSRDELAKLVKDFFSSFSRSIPLLTGKAPNLTIGLELSIPDFLLGEEAIGPDGKVVGTYGDYVEEAARIVDAIFDVLLGSGSFLWPQVVVKVRNEKDMDVIRELVERSLASPSPIPLIAILSPQWQTKNAFYSGNGYRVESTSDDWQSTLKSAVAQSIALNTLKIARESKGDEDVFLEKLEQLIEISLRAFQVKHSYVKMYMERRPKGNVLYASFKGEDYISLENLRYNVFLADLSGAVRELTGQDLFRTRRVAKVALKALDRVAKCIDEHELDLNVNISFNFVEPLSRFVEQEESHSKRLLHFSSVPPPTNVGLASRYKVESLFHRRAKGGHFFYLLLTERFGVYDELMRLLDRTFKKQNLGLVVISRVYTRCARCGHQMMGEANMCPRCKSSSKNLSRMFLNPCYYAAAGVSEYRAMNMGVYSL